MKQGRPNPVAADPDVPHGLVRERPVPTRTQVRILRSEQMHALLTRWQKTPYRPSPFRA
ncbi:hypothetical protein SCOCK_140142 [Actinacidiphila cocklensis]|uniref:Uncharacterized protein n=1 Tax=Actinacidiphila cocklensis TaxID=887465 RepID=A0A9W4DKN7_9ACTN|nr:hypothetical protein SCOCK_140142 [Actinacidiphila cocklensis]